MKKDLIKQDILNEATSVLGKRVRITRAVWDKLKSEKHPEKEVTLENIKRTISESLAVYQSRLSKKVFLYYKKFDYFSIITVVRHLNGDGFLITSYMSTKEKLNLGKQIWPE